MVIDPIHSSVRGRVRYKVNGLYRSKLLKAHLESQLIQEEDVTRVSASTLTGNLLVNYNSRRFTSDIAKLIQRAVSDYKVKALNFQKHIANKQDDILPRIKSKEKRPFVSKRKLRRLVARSQKQVGSESWHLREAVDTIMALDTSITFGLSGFEAKRRFKKYGPNVLPEALSRSGFKIFLDQFRSFPVGMLAVAAGISLLTGGILDAVAIMGVVGINTIIGYVTESRSDKIIHSLKSLVRPRTLVRRDEKVKDIGAEDVVPGDVLVLRPGQYVAADARLIETERLTIDESSLTGESVPVSKMTDVLYKRNIPLSDRSNMCYMGTLVTGGQGLAVVVATGRFTEMGRIQAMLTEAEITQTPMEKQLDQIGTRLVLVSGLLCGIVFVIGILRGYGFLLMFKTAISLAVAAIPEGLPAVATTTLALGIREMHRHNVLVRHLSAVETLGSVQIICLDKTGTITFNRMSVVEIFVGTWLINVSKNRFEIFHESILPIFREELAGLVVCSALCNESELIQIHGGYLVKGSPTENAFIYMAQYFGLDVPNLRENFYLIKTIYRSERSNIMITFHKTINGKILVAVKGSPTEVLSLCTLKMRQGKTTLLEDADYNLFQTENERMAGKALRVIAVAYRLMEYDENTYTDEEFMPCNLVWLGLLGIADPVRKGAKKLIARFHRAGIRTVMITGDQGPTAYAIAKDLNLSGEEPLRILDSTSLVDIDSQALQALCQQSQVFARVSPSHKLQIVQNLQKAGKVVAMTGDGINDSPALKAADIGIAMGQTGTDVAREVASVVLEDDNIETMIIAVGQGRTIYNNVRKSLHFLLATNFSEIMVTFAATMVGLGQPLSSMQLLWINLITDIFPGLALSMEAPEKDILNRPPRDPDNSMINSSDFKKITREAGIISLGAISSYVYGVIRYGKGLRASSIAFQTLTLSQLLHAITCRSEQHSIFDLESQSANKYLTVALGGSFILQAMTPVVPGLRSLLGLDTIGMTDFLIIGINAPLPFLLNEIAKKAQNGNV